MKDAPDTRHSLLARLRGDGNDSDWSEFVALYEPAIYRFARRQGLQDADAREIVQEVLLGVRSHSSNPSDLPSGSFRAWLARVTKNRVIDLVRARSRKDKLLSQLRDQASMDGSQDPFLYEVRHQVFLAASQQVQKQVASVQWQAFWQTAVEMSAASEVAERLGMSIGNVYVARCRVMAKIREEIERLSYSEPADGEATW